MKLDQVVFKAKSNGYWFYQDSEGIVAAFNEQLYFNDNDKTNPSIYRSLCNCKSQKEFEQEIIYLVNKIQEV